MTDKRPRNISNDIVDMIEKGTRKWTRQKKAEEKYPGKVRYRHSRMTMERAMTQKAAAWKVLEQAYMAASANNTLPAMARQIYYQARPLIMKLTYDKELAYGYFSQTLLPDYIEEMGKRNWNVVYDARGSFAEPHTNRRIGCGTVEVDNYLAAIKEPALDPAEFTDANVDIIGPDGGFGAVLFCEKEGFNPLFKAVNLANRRDIMIISTKGVSVTAARRLCDEICGTYRVPLFILHDFDVAGFLIFATLQRDTRRYQFSNSFETIDLGLRIDDVAGLEREPAARSKIEEEKLIEQLQDNDATDEGIEILLHERVELNAMTSDAFIAMIERKLDEFGLEKVIPTDEVLTKAYEGFYHSQKLRKIFETMEKAYKKDPANANVDLPDDLRDQIAEVLDEHPNLRWDDAIQIVLGEELDHVKKKKQEAQKKSGDFTGADSDDEPVEMVNTDGEKVDVEEAVRGVLGEGFVTIKSGKFTGDG